MLSAPDTWFSILLLKEQVLSNGLERPRLYRATDRVVASRCGETDTRVATHVAREYDFSYDP